MAATKAQVAQIIVAEAKARNHTRDECLAELSALYQESQWDETIWGPAGKRITYGVAQQDGSYPHRFDGAAAQIRAFFDKLDVKRAAPGRGDIWLNICWLQQAPNWPSAQYWLDHGRTAYLAEIRSRIATVTPYLDKYWPITGGTTPMAVSGDPIWLEDVLREALGDRLVVHDGWKERGAGGTMGVIWGTMIHHTGNVNERVEVIRDGVQQPSGWLPGPLSQCLITPDGKCHLIAVGPCNHAGGGNWGTLTNGNGSAIGFECAYSGSGPWPQKQIVTMRDAAAAISKKIGKKAADSVCGHKEYAKPQGRKVDPGNMDMNWFRGEVQKDLDGFVFPGEATTTVPPVPDPVPPLSQQQLLDQIANDVAWLRQQQDIGLDVWGEDGDLGRNAKGQRRTVRAALAALIRKVGA